MLSRRFALAASMVVPASLLTWTLPVHAGPPAPDHPLHILVFSKTAGFRHDSIPAGVDALHAIAREHAFELTATEDAAAFTDDALAPFDVVVFLSTTGDVLNDDQQAAFERFIAAGGGYVGIHAAADTEYDWPFYGALVGAYFKGHPPVQEATILIEDNDHPSTAHLSEHWVRRDEWYDYRSNPRLALPAGTPDSPGPAGPPAPPSHDPDDPASPADPPRVRVLASLIATSYQGGTMGDDHPIAWCHEYAGGRAWYTGGGHTIESFVEPDFLRHIAGGILWAGGID